MGWAEKLGATIAALALASCTSESEGPPKGAYTVYVSNEGSGDVSVIDPVSRSQIAKFAVGKRPRGMALSPDGSLLYVAVSGSPIAGPGVEESALPPPDKSADGIAVVDLRSRRLLRVMPGVSDPEQIAVSPDGNRLYVASEDTGRLLVMNAANGRVLANLEVGVEPEGVAVSKLGDFVLATSEADNQLTIVAARGQPRVIAKVPVGMRPRHAAFSADELRIFVTGELDSSVTLVELGTRKVTRTIHLPDPGSKPMSVAVSRAGDYVYVTTGRGGKLARIQAKKFRYVDAVAVGGRPWGLALSPDDRWGFTANGPSNDVAVIDLATMSVAGKIRAGTKPWGAVMAETRE